MKVGTRLAAAFMLVLLLMLVLAHEYQAAYAKFISSQDERRMYGEYTSVRDRYLREQKTIGVARAAA